ncbi:MAG: dihydrolipoyl dehydrogenase [Deltaproteobacteria bacterium]|nr:MAG: dihydrolipoyl dehydrogenase [Deltaproteobacteria bacterium]
MADRYDLVVIGAGPGGYVAAIRAAQLGMRVACVEKDAALGGTCLNVGCIPSKALLDSSELFHQARHGLGAHGVNVSGVELDLGAMMTRKDRVVRGLTQGVASLFKKNKVVWVQGAARLAAPGRVAVRGAQGEQTLEAARVLIASGSEPAPLRTLPFDGERIVSSTEALSLSRVPARMLVVGAGAVGLELGSVWSRLGAEVTVVEIVDRILPGMDGGMAGQLQRALERQGLSFRLATEARGAVRAGNGVRVTVASKDGSADVEADVVLVAIGRRPYMNGLGVRELGVKVDERGRIVVNDRFETSVAGVFAIGDVIAGPMLAHKASEEGVIAVECMAGQPAHVNYDAIPNIVYTWPELASVGLSEEEAAARGVAVAVGTFPFVANGRARCLNETDGGVKVLAGVRTDRIVGLHILGPRASDLIAEAALAMEFDASAEDVARSIHGHPTLPEAIKEAALAVSKRAIHI